MTKQATLRVTVTQADIDGGTRFDVDNCAVARAINRSLSNAGLALSASVGVGNLSYFRNLASGKRSARAVGHAEFNNVKVDNFIRLFDAGKKPRKPYPTFSVALPEVKEKK